MEVGDEKRTKIEYGDRAYVLGGVDMVGKLDLVALVAGRLIGGGRHSGVRHPLRALFHSRLRCASQQLSHSLDQ